MKYFILVAIGFAVAAIVVAGAIKIIREIFRN
jgi:hypothetical protein